MPAEITHLFRATPREQLLGKLYNFRRRSLGRYALAAALLTLARPDLLGHFVLTWLGLTAGFGLLGLAVVYASRHRLAPAPFPATVTFRAERIEVRPADGSPAQTHDWRWVRRADESDRYFFLTVRDFPRLILLLDKQKLSPEETTTFQTWLAARPAAG